MVKNFTYLVFINIYDLTEKGTRGFSILVQNKIR